MKSIEAATEDFITHCLNTILGRYRVFQVKIQGTEIVSVFSQHSLKQHMMDIKTDKVEIKHRRETDIL